MEETLNPLKKYKSLGPNGWIVELFLEFYDLMIADLLEVVEDSRKHGRIMGSLNATFIALIPKESNPSSFNELPLISLFNLVYKLN